MSTVRIDFESLLDEDFDEGKLLRRARPTYDLLASRDLLGEHATAHGLRLLDIACAQIIAIVRSSPGGRDIVLMKTYLMAKGSAKKYADLFNATIIPNMRAGTPNESEAFTDRYLTRFHRTYGKLEQLGLEDVPSALRWQPLDVTYVSLSTSKAIGPDGVAALGHMQHVRYQSSHTGARPVELELAAIARERELRRKGIRLILWGGAGSGKTTVIRWLATRCAMSVHRPDALGNALEYFRARLPILVNMRDAFQTRTAAPSDHLDVLRGAVGEGSWMPGTWLQSRLSPARSIILIDGLDEVPLEHRSAADRLVRELCDAYPDVPIIISSRVEGINFPLVAELEFSLLQLNPMDPLQIGQCVEQWFDALCAGSLPSQAELYRQRQHQLELDLRTNPHLVDMAETPLLAAMLCAYYANGSSSAPAHRTELVARVVRVLIDSRDRARGLFPGEHATISEARKQRLLGRAAYEMSQTGMSTLNLSEGSDPELLRYLARRSSLLLMVSPDEAEFPHRTFQEYFAAYHLAMEGDIGSLFALIGSPGWSNILPFFVSIANDADGATVVSRLQRHTDSYPEPLLRRGIVFCLAECAANLSERSAGLTEELRVSIRQVLPPQSSAEVAVIAALGEDVVDILPQPRHLDELVAYIDVARRVRGTTALNMLASYTDISLDQASRQAIADCWVDYDTVPFLSSVLSRIDLTGITVNVTELSQFVVLRDLAAVRRLHIKSLDDWTADLSALLDCNRLTDLDLSGFHGLASLDGAERLAYLRRIRLPRGGSIGQLAPLARCARLREVYIDNCESVTDLSPLREVAELRVLRLGNCSAGLADQLKAGFERLVDLSIGANDLRHVDFVRSLPMVGALRVQSRGGIAHTSALGSADQLRHLAIDLSPGSTLFLPSAGGLETLRVSGSFQLDSEAALRAQVRLRRCELDRGIVDLTDLDVFSANVALQRLHLRDARSVSSLDGLEKLGALRSLAVTGSRIETIDEISWLGRLEDLDLSDNHRLVDLTPLLSARGPLRHVRALNVPPVCLVEVLLSNTLSFDLVSNTEEPWFAFEQGVS